MPMKLLVTVEILSIRLPKCIYMKCAFDLMQYEASFKFGKTVILNLHIWTKNNIPLSLHVYYITVHVYFTKALTKRSTENRVWLGFCVNGNFHCTYSLEGLGKNIKKDDKGATNWRVTAEKHKRKMWITSSHI